MTQPIFERHTEAAHMGEEFDPWQEEPQTRTGDTDKNIFADEIEKAETRKQEHNGSEFSR